MTALGVIFAVVVTKEFFGGLGANVFNPALSGRAFLIMSFPAAITTWHRPVGFGQGLTDAVTSATPLNIIKLGGSMADVGANFVKGGLAPGADYGSILWTLFVGNRAGCIGETSILLILAGAVYLLITKTIDWRAPVAMIVTTFLGSVPSTVLSSQRSQQQSGTDTVPAAPLFVLRSLDLLDRLGREIDLHDLTCIAVCHQ